MAESQSGTDQEKSVKLESAIQAVFWSRPVASPGEKVGLRVFTQFVGVGSDIRIEIIDRRGKKHVKHEDTTGPGFYQFEFKIPETAQEALLADVKLPKHGLKSESGILTLVPRVQITNAEWDREVARRGDSVGLSADIEGAQDGTDAVVEIYEHDQDGAHDPIAIIPTTVSEDRVDLQWEYEYNEDTDDIPTDQETEQGYRPPEYFFRVIAGGVSADSGLLQFQDTVEIRLNDETGRPVADEEYVLTLPDGSERKGTLDEKGYALEEDVPPGPVRIEFPNVDSTGSVVDD